VSSWVFKHLIGEGAHMDTEFLAALDNAEDLNESHMTTQALSPSNLPTSQLKQLELLQHLSSYSELLILMCAEKGMGKTFIAKALFAAREIPDQSLMLEADSSLSYLDILHNLAQFLDLADLASDIDGIEQKILDQCLQITEEDHGSILLIIDQVEQLSDDALEDINQLALLAPSALHIMLLAPLGFESKLLALAQPQAPFHIMDIEPLTDDEAEVLLIEQFPKKEWEAEQVDYIVQQSAGNPGKILYLAKQLLSGLKSPQETLKTQKFPVTHAAAMALVAFALIGTYFYQNSSTVIASQPMQDAEVIAFEPATLPELPSLSGDVDMESNLGKTEPSEPEQEIDFNFPEADEVAVIPPQDTDSDKLVLSEQVVSELAVNKPAELKEPVINYSKDEQILLSASNSAFVIQLFGAYSADNTAAFMSVHATKAMKLLSYQTEYKDKPWHVVIAGPFESKVAALQQSKGLSVKLRNQKPWVRPVSAIQAELISKK
jgi:DamX protein